MFQHDLPQKFFQDPQAELGVFGVDLHVPSVWLPENKTHAKTNSCENIQSFTNEPLQPGGMFNGISWERSCLTIHPAGKIYFQSGVPKRSHSAKRVVMCVIVGLVEHSSCGIGFPDTRLPTRI